ncbi:DExH-box ATP-dependent RNA helicase DExH1 [Selaginella moellendorffii]|nr:DExH-box ATP-dependent RNA helicase DExH1 [Selaginella moellendorffii]|eukprot:XP_002973866.2 DExH-box ATP-dependent RNA helicase DExH1 [Selaginella moellendorffii]
MHVQNEGSFHCRVILPDAKKSELDVILWCRADSPSSQESHHRAAVMALHHVMGDRRLDRILPEEYRQQWHDLDAAAAEREAKLKMKLEKPKRVAYPPRELQSVFMSEGNRKLVEEVITDSTGSVEEAPDFEDQAQALSSLVEMGFKEEHIESALERANSISSALDWLMLNVDESDLPARFAPQASKAAVRVVQRAVEFDPTQNAIALELAQYGYSYEQCVAAFQETGSFDLAISKLFHIAVQGTKTLQATVSWSDLSAMREEELVAIGAIYPTAVLSNELLKFDVELPPQSGKRLEMEVRISTDSSYPFEIPVLGFRCKDLDASYLQAVTKKVANRALELLGIPMIYDLVCYAAEVSLQLLSEPVKVDDRGGDVKRHTSADSKAHVVAGKQRSSRQWDEIDCAAESTRLKDDWERLQTSRQYADIMTSRRSLPVFKRKSEILAGISCNPVTIICGETGCGKSTQIPQYVLEKEIEMGNGGSCNIICTQPRRISALGLAARVAMERNEVVGRVVGYSVRLDSCCSKFTRLLFCTTGILLRRLLSDPELEGVTHVIVDEVHERTLESDLLLLLLREHIQRTRGKIRVILMSATAETSLFSDYFQQGLGLRPELLRVQGFTFPVRELHLDDVLELTGYKVTKNSRFATNKKAKSEVMTTSASNSFDSWESRVGENSETNMEYSEATMRSLDTVDESVINYELIELLLSTVFSLEREVSDIYGPLVAVDDTSNWKPEAGSVLVFLPGMMEISKLQARLQNSKQLSAYGVEKKWVLALHGSLSSEQQKRVFVRPPRGVRKVVLATNVAETSITIDDILYVIDTGRHKEMSYDHSKGLSCLQETWVSKASCKQRAGRAGRVQPGCCLRLYSKKQFKAFDDHQLPEIQRVSLEGLCLKVKSLLQSKVQSTLSKMPTPPDPDAVIAAVQSLKDINAFDAENETLTPLGRHLTQMPVDARVGKMLVFGCMLKCLDPVLTIAASMSGRPVFFSPQDNREEARLAKLRLSGTSKSDHIALVAAYNGWITARRDGWEAEKDYCASNFLSREALASIEASREDYLNVLRELGFVPGDISSLEASSNSVRVIKAVVCAGFYPKIARVRHPEKTYVQTEGGTVPKLAAAHEVQYFTRLDGRVFLHPASVNFSAGHFESPWLVVTDMVKTSKVYARETSMVPAYSLLIFGGSISVRHERQMIVVDGWLEFEAPARIAVLIKELRKRVDALLLEKTGNPGLDISSSAVVAALLRLLETDGF